MTMASHINNHTHYHAGAGGLSDEELAQAPEGALSPPGSRRIPRDRLLDRAWEMKRCRETAEEGLAADFQVLVRPHGRDSLMLMDMDEVKACRDLGIKLPSDWTVEIPASAFARGPVSSLGGDPAKVKARLKTWALAVTLASAFRLGG